VFVEQLLDFIELLARDDWIMESGMDLALMDDLPDVDAVPKQVEKRSPAEWLPACKLSIPARPKLRPDPAGVKVQAQRMDRC
jgi:hypothetical protein